MRWYATAFLVLAMVGCDGTREPVGPGAEQESSLPNREIGRQMVAVEMIVTLEPRINPVEFARANGIVPTFVYTHVMNGFAGRISDAAYVGLLRDNRVRRIERAAEVTTTGEEPASTWGLDRIDQRSLPLDGTYHYDATGAGVSVYIVDTGGWWTHVEFNSPSGELQYRRIFPGYDAFDGYPIGYAVDCNGHGTHVSGTIGGNTVGVARGVKLYAVRVLDCAGSGTWATVIAGLDWIIANADHPAVVNMSLGGAASQTVNDAVERVIAAGIPVVVAAGNSDVDACNVSPAGAPDALTIGASDKTDSRAWFSNWGDCVDLFAPGVEIRSATYGSDSRYVYGTGTSMASPHAAGAAALVLERNPDASPATVAASLMAMATRDVVANAKTVNNRLLYSLGNTNPGGGGMAPNASFAFTCAGLVCDFTDGSSDAEGPIASWNWAFDDGTGSKLQSPTHEFAASGTYQVTLTVTDGDGMTDAMSRTVSVPTGSGTAPTADFTFACTDLACVFTVGSSDAEGSLASWQWAFGDGTNSGQQNPGHTFAASGTYQVTLTVTDADGLTDAASRDVSVVAATNSNLPPASSFTFQCVRLQCDFLDGSSDPDGTIVERAWDFGDGATSVRTTADNLTHDFSSSGVYPVSLTVTDDGGAVSSYSAEVPVGLIVTLTSRRPKGMVAIDILWTGAESTDVDIWVNHQLQAVVPDSSGSYTYSSGLRGQNSFTIQVCESGARTMCSAEETISS